MSIRTLSKKAALSAVFCSVLAARVQADEIRFSGSYDVGTDDVSSLALVASVPSEGEGGGGITELRFAVPEGETRQYDNSFVRREGLAGISLVKYGKGTAEINLKNFQTAIGGHANGRLVIEEGNAVLYGGGWYVNPGDVLVELKNNCSASTKATAHVLGGPSSDVRYVLQPGARLHFTKEQYFSANGNTFPNFTVMGNTVISTGSDFRPSANPFVVTASGVNNRFEGLFTNYSATRRFEIAPEGELVFTSALPAGTTTVTGGGKVVVETWQSANAGTWILQNGSTLSLADSCTSLPLSNLTLSDGCRVTTGSQPVALPGAILTCAETATITGVWTSTPDADFSAGLVLPEGNTFVLTAQNINSDFSGLTVAGTLRVDTPTLRQLPATLELSSLNGIEISGTVLPGDLVFLRGVESLPANLPPITAGSAADGEWVVENGALVLRVTEKPEVAARQLTWTPATDEAAWDSTGANWTDTLGEAQVWTDGSPSVFTGEESNYHETVSVTETLAPARTVFSGARNYTLTGSALAGGPVLKTGGGTLTVDGAGFTDQAVVVEDGTLKIGANAGETALGTRAGVLTVKGSGVLDVNYTSSEAGSSDAAVRRHNITHRKTIVLEDGARIVNNNMPTYCTFGETLVSGTVSLGGTARMDWRNYGKDPDYNKTPVLRGDADSVVRIDNSAAVGFVGTDVSVGKIEVLSGGKLRPEAKSTRLTVPQGIHLKDGATFQYYDVNNDAVLVVDEGTATIDKNYGTSDQRAVLEVKSGTTASVTGSNTVRLLGGIRNDGTIEQASGRLTVSSEISGAGGFHLKSGTLELNGGAGSAGTVTVEQDGGTLDIPRLEGQSGFAALDELVVNNKGGDVHLRSDVAGICDATTPITLTGGKGTFYAYGKSNDQEYGAKAVVKGQTERLSIGLNNSRRGTLELKPGSDLTVNNLYLGDVGSSPAAGRLIIDTDATVTISGSGNGIRLGHWSGEPSIPADHQLIVDGGELLSPSQNIQVSYDSPGVLFEVRGGLVQAKGFESYRTSWLHSPDHQRRIRQTGGVIELGDIGFNMGTFSHGHDWVDLIGGTLKITKACGTSIGFDCWFGREEAGELTIDTDAALFNLNVALKGRSAVTLVGASNFNCLGNDRLAADRAHPQGSPLGKWTVRATGRTTLHGARYFAGGLEAASGASVFVGSYSTNPLPSAIASGQVHTQMLQLPEGAFSQYADCDDLTYVHTKFNTGSYGLKTLGWIGEFKVEEDDAGTWTFAGLYDDNLALSIGNQQVFSSTGYKDVGVGQVYLTPGWHKFRVCAFDDHGVAGPNQSTWSNGKAIGFLKGTSTSKDSADYTTFSGANVQMRRPTSLEVSHLKARRDGSDWETMEDYATTFVTNSIALLNDTAAEELNSGSANRYRGWFKVPTTGVWQFRCNYDDCIAVRIDGERVCRSGYYSTTASGSKRLTTGWHFFEIRCADGSGDYSRFNLPACVMLTPPDGAEIAFDETNFEMVAPHLRPDVGTADLMVAQDASVTNDGTVPFGIYGRLSGTGTLSGAFVFAGEENVWSVTEGEGRTATTVSFENPSETMLAGLRRIEFRTAGKPQRAAYRVSPAYGLTAELAAAIEVTATDGTTDYSASFTASVENGDLVLRNARPAGLIIIIQ